MLFMAKLICDAYRRICCNTQGIVDGQLAYEGTIIGTQM